MLSYSTNKILSIIKGKYNRQSVFSISNYFLKSFSILKYLLLTILSYLSVLITFSHSFTRIITVIISKIVGFIISIPVPYYLRAIVYNIYIKIYKVNKNDIKNKNLYSYRSINDFFIREIDISRRKLDNQAKYVSPCDGTILSTSIINKNDLIIVKNKVYNLDNFLFGGLGLEYDCLEKSKCKNKRYAQVTIYLSPADYHRFHSPADLVVTDRIHIAGNLCPVMPSFVDRYPDTFLTNERVTLKCMLNNQSEKDFFITYVAAFNVGSIYLNHDGFNNYEHKKIEEHVVYNNDSKYNIRKFEEMGYFKFGSTIVMILPLEENESINLVPGRKIFLGEKIL